MHKLDLLSSICDCLQSDNVLHCLQSPLHFQYQIKTSDVRANEQDSDQKFFSDQQTKIIHENSVPDVRFYTLGRFGLACLKLKITANNFLVIFGRSHSFLGITSSFFWQICLAQGHNMATRVGLEPRPLDPESEMLTTRPPHPFRKKGCKCTIYAAKTKAMISCVVTSQLICAFV